MQERRIRVSRRQSKRHRFYQGLSIPPPEQVAAFDDLAHLQRGEPESAMDAVQEAANGGVLSFVVEHAGDLIHRMTEHTAYGYDGRVNVLDKIQKVLRVLKEGYGFAREHRENMESNARYRAEPLGEMLGRVDAALDRYARAHAALPVYNRAQWLARRAAVALGKKRWSEAVGALERLQKLASNTEAWYLASKAFGRK